MSNVEHVKAGTVNNYLRWVGTVNNWLGRHLRAREQHGYAFAAPLWLGRRGPLTRAGLYELVPAFGLCATTRTRPTRAVAP
jgi:hypothetical protein